MDGTPSPDRFRKLRPMCLPDHGILSGKFLLFQCLLAFILPLKGCLALSVLFGFGTNASRIGLPGTPAYIISAAALLHSIDIYQIPIVGVRFFASLLACSVILMARYWHALCSPKPPSCCSINLQLTSVQSPQLKLWHYPQHPSRPQPIAYHKPVHWLCMDGRDYCIGSQSDYSTGNK